VLEKATGEIEVFPVLDGYSIPDEEVVKDPRVTYVTLEKTGYMKKRHGINKIFNEYAKGEFFCWLDAHIMLSFGFDEELIRNSAWNKIQIPRRYRLDPLNWCIQKQHGKPDFIDYEHFLISGLVKHELHGFRSDDLTLSRLDLLEDDIQTCQGSFFFLERTWFKQMNFMDLGYQGLGEEAEEVVLNTVYNGGLAKVNKKCWYAHLHKSKGSGGRGYHKDQTEAQRSYNYAWQKLVVDNKQKFIDHIKKFPVDPTYPNNWETLI
jgi:hypothetical protein